MDKQMIYAVPEFRDEPQMCIYSAWYKKNKGNYHANFIYLHRKLDEINRYDICLTNDEWVDSLTDGIYPVRVNLWSLGIREATLFYARGYGGCGRYGLVVDNYDDEGLKEAKEQIEERWKE